MKKRKLLDFQFNKKPNLMNISIYICQEVMNKMTQMQHNKTKQNKNENTYTRIKDSACGRQACSILILIANEVP